MKKINIFCAALFVILNPVIIIIYSYMDRIKLAASSASEYFIENISSNLGLKLIISVFLSSVIALILRYFLLRKKFR